MQLEHELEQHKVGRKYAGEIQKESTLHLEDERIPSDHNIKEESTLHVDTGKDFQSDYNIQKESTLHVEASKVGKKAGKGVGMHGRGAAARLTPRGGMPNLKLQSERFEQNKVDSMELDEMHTLKLQE